MRILLAILGVLLMLELGVGPADVRQWGSWTLRLVFPSRDVTGAKVLCLAGGLALTFYYLVVAASHRHCGRSSAIATASRACSPRVLSPRADKTPISSTARSHSSACEARAAVPATPGPVAALGPTPLQPMVEYELPQLKLANECQSPGISSSSSSSASNSIHVNGKEPIPFENDLFKGQLLFLVRDSTPSSTASATTNKRGALRTNWSHLFNDRRRTLWIQVQGQFKRVPPPDTMLFLAAEVTSPLVVGFWTRKLIDVLASVMKKIARNVHIAFGEASDSDELPHAAFPLYECADEVVETPVDPSDVTSIARAPMLGVENFGESPQQRDLRVRGSARKTFALDRVYTFQCYTMYADLAQWQIANLPGMPEIPLKKLIGDQPVRLAAYMAPASGAGATPVVQHSSAVKDYLFCFSVRYSEEAKRARAASNSAYGSLTPSMRSSSSSSATAPPVLCSPTASSLRCTLLQEQQQSPRVPALVCDEDSNASDASADCTDETQALPQKLVQHEQALQTLKFALPMWIEQVDRVAGNRKVSYLFSVEEQPPVEGTTAVSNVVGHRYSVVRSAATIKNALLLLQDADVDAEADEARSGSSSTAASVTRSHEDEFRKLLVESREFLYETISSETLALADALQKIASTNALPTSSSAGSAGHRLARLKKAMLYHCLKSSGTLPSVRAPQDIGIQLTQAKRERMDIICECGVYRVHMPRLLRQEWLVLTTSDVLFFRSYSMRACKSVPITELLRVQAVDTAHVLNPEGTDRDSDGDIDCTGWHCVELHLLCEIVTVFFDSKRARRQFVASLNQIALLRARPGCLSTLRALETQALPLCLNRRNMLSELGASAGLFTATTSADATTARVSPLVLVRDALEKGLAMYEMDAKTRRSSDLLPFLDAVELLADMVLPGGDDAVVLSANSTSAADVTTAVLSPPVPQPWAAASSAVLPFSHEEKLAFALNLYHVLYIHATLVFAMPMSHFQWKKMQSVPCYIIGRAPHRQWRVTLDMIENELLRVSATAPGGTSTSSSVLTRPNGAAGSARKLLSLGKSSSSSNGAGTIDGSAPRHLAITHPDFRTSFALQMNCSPGTHVMRVYDASQRIHEQLNATCARFLSRELRMDAAERTVWLPRVVKWRQQDFLPRTTRNKKDASAALAAITTGIGASTDARTFYCLQKLLGFLEEPQRDRVQTLLLGAGKSARILYDSFWTEPSSGSANASNASSIKLRSTKSERSPTKPSGAANTSAPQSATSARQFFQAFF